MTMTGARVSYLYDLMDAAYDAAIMARGCVERLQPPIIEEARPRLRKMRGWR